MLKRYLFALLSTCLVVPVWAEWNEESPELEVSDSIVVEVNDTIEVDLNNDPEWYVPPISREVNLVPRRAVAASACLVDSVRTFDIDSVLTEVTWYNYDKAGRITCTTVWSCNPDGSRVGKSKEEAAFDAYGTQVLSATYDWDNTTNDWHGLSRTEDVFNENGKLESQTIYEWVNNDWLDMTLYTYQYDAANREIEFLTYTRAANDQLELSKGRIHEYNAAGKTTLDIQYSAYTNDEPTAGTKSVYDFDAKGNQILKEYYSSYNNGDWVGSTREVWEFIDNTTLKTYYEKKIWSNGTWVNNAKETWTYYNNTASKVILHETFSGSNDTWVLTLQENKGFNSDGNNTSIENYSYTNGVAKGTQKKDFLYSGKSQIGNITYTWKNDAWVKNVWTVADKVSVPNESCKYNWSTAVDDWVGTGSRTLSYLNTNPTEVIAQTWSTTDADWVNATKKTTKSSGGKTTQEASFTWDTDHWVGTARSDWTYNAKGLNDTIKTYTPSGTDWIYSKRTVKTYNAAGTEIMTHTANWDGTLSKWVLESMTRKDIVSKSDASGRQELTASWHCGADSIWKGQQYDSTSYTTSGKILYKIHSEAWSNNDWVPKYKIEYKYDDAEQLLIQQQFDWISNAWQGHYRDEYGYDEAGRTISYATYNSWNIADKKWVGLSKTETQYDSHGNITGTLSYSWKNNDWLPSLRNTNTFDDKNRLIEKLVESFANGVWVNMQKNTKVYVGNTLTKDNTYNWVNNDWVFRSRNESFYDNDAQAKLRREITGMWTNGVMQSFSDNLYFYSCDLFTVQFKNYDGTLLSSIEIENGKIPEYTGTPTKPENAQYTYTFKGWDPVVQKVTGNAVYTADFDSIVKHYLIVFKDKDGKIIDGRNWDYGTTPTCAEPTKPATAKYTYSFKEWIPAVEAVTQEATYIADLDSVVNQYTVAFLGYDDAELQSSLWNYGATPSFDGDVPVKAKTDQYTYSFKGWDKAIVEVIGDATYKAELDSVVNKYTVHFVDEDELTELFAVTLDYGDTPVYGGETPTKPEDDHFTYAFKDWSPEIEPVTAEATYKAEFTATPKVPTAVGNVQTDDVARKMLINGTLYITREGNIYTISGQKVNR